MFNTDGVFRLVSLPSIPMLKGIVSAKANFGKWQLAQLTEESLESIFSENNFLPSPAFVFTSAFSSLKKELTITIVKPAIRRGSMIFFITPNVQPML